MRNPVMLKNLSICLVAAAAAACNGSAGDNRAANAAYGNEVAPPAEGYGATNAATNTDAPAAEIYHAGGTEPFWSLTIGGGQMSYHPADGPDVSEALPAQTAIANGYKYVGTQMTVEVVHTSCNNGMSEETFADTVHLTVGGQPRNGCGGQGDGVH